MKQSQSFLFGNPHGDWSLLVDFLPSVIFWTLPHLLCLFLSFTISLPFCLTWPCRLFASLCFCLPLFLPHPRVSIHLLVGGFSTSRWWESSGTACVTAGHSTDPSFPAHCPPALLLGILSTGERWCWRGHGRSQPPPPTHGTAGAEPQSYGSVLTTASTVFSLLLSQSLAGV